MEQHEEVIMVTGRLIKLDRGNIDALALRAEAYYKIGEVRLFDPSDSSLAACLDSEIDAVRSPCGEVDSALKHLREGLRHDPEHKASKKLYKVLRKLERKMKVIVNLTLKPTLNPNI